MFKMLTLSTALVFAGLSCTLEVTSSEESASAWAWSGTGNVEDWAWRAKVRHLLKGGKLKGMPAGSRVYAAKVVRGAGTVAYQVHHGGAGAWDMRYWPASVVKVASSVGALEFLKAQGFTGNAQVRMGGSNLGSMRSVYTAAIRDSSNIQYNRTVQIAGFDWLNQHFLKERGLPGMTIQRSYVAGAGVRHSPAISMSEKAWAKNIAARSGTTFRSCASSSRDPNCAPMFDLGEVVRRVLLHKNIRPHERFKISPADVAGLRNAMCGSTQPFFQTGARAVFGGKAQICHKAGWVPGNACVDHGLISDGKGGQYILAASVPWPGSNIAHCHSSLGAIAKSVLASLKRPSKVVPIQPTAGRRIRAKIKRLVGPGAGYRVDVRAQKSVRVEAWVNRKRVPARSQSCGTHACASFTFPFKRRQNYLVSIRAWAGGKPVGFKSRRVFLR